LLGWLYSRDEGKQTAGINFLKHIFAASWFRHVLKIWSTDQYVEISFSHYPLSTVTSKVLLQEAHTIFLPIVFAHEIKFTVSLEI
jgi:hypothetical protein